eukprot:8734318-Ditylum_brightwellii.AAC.1
MKFFQGIGEEEGAVEAMIMKSIEIGRGYNVKFQKLYNILTSCPNAQYLQLCHGPTSCPPHPGPTY